MSRSIRVLAALTLGLHAAGATPPAAAQVWRNEVGEPLSAPIIGGLAEDRDRLLQNLGLRESTGFLLRSPSSLLASDTTTLSGGNGWRLLLPALSTAWSSAIPASRNDGTLWAGKGASALLTFGVRGSMGPLTLTLAPALAYSANSPFNSLLPDSMGFEGVLPPWREGIHSADLPVRFGRGALTRLHPGESSLVLRMGPLEGGAATESQWWGPGLRNAIVLSDNAGGLPHLFLRTGRPLRTGIGDFEARWMVAHLAESAHFDSVGANDHRSLSGLAATFRPAAEPDLTLGLARVVYGRTGGTLSAYGRALDVITTWRDNVPEGEEEIPESGREQILSLFARWLFPEDGFELYGEWARTEIPASLRDLLTRPFHSQGYLIGLQWGRPLRSGDLVRLHGELVNLEESSTALGRYTPRFYTSPIVPQGYTHRGQVIGASIGPGSSSQYAGVDYLAGRWQVGLFGERIRWDNDAYYADPNYAFAHDVTVMGGVRGGARLGGVLIEAEVTTGTRFDYLFQNTAFNHETATDSAVDVRNHTLRLTVSPVRSARSVPRPAAPVPVPVPVPAAVESRPAAARGTGERVNG
jgi:hypothetical protein